MTLEGKSALVLGGSRGIGAAIVERLTRDGAHVTFTYAGSKEAAEKLAGRIGAKAVHADSTDRKAIDKLIGGIDKLDILVINAGVYEGGDARELPAEAVDRLIDVNIRAPYHAAAAAGRKMKDGGRIIVIGSINGDRAFFPGAAAYAMSKSAMQGLVRGLARDFGPQGITVNNVQPGPVDTDMNPASGDFAEMLKAGMAIKRYGRADEIAGMVAYLVSPEAAFVTGAMHTIDGGIGA